MSIEPDKEFSMKCHEFGWRCTPQRLAVYHFLKGNGSHPDIDSVWHAVRRDVPSITRESVYRILNEFCDKKLLDRVDQIALARYDTRIGPHGHLICERCGRIFDFDWPEGVQLPEGLVKESIHHMEIRIVGICRECSEKSEN